VGIYDYYDDGECVRSSLQRGALGATVAAATQCKLGLVLPAAASPELHHTCAMHAAAASHERCGAGASSSGLRYYKPPPGVKRTALPLQRLRTMRSSAPMSSSGPQPKALPRPRQVAAAHCGSAGCCFAAPSFQQPWRLLPPCSTTTSRRPRVTTCCLLLPATGSHRSRRGRHRRCRQGPRPGPHHG